VSQPLHTVLAVCNGGNDSLARWVIFIAAALYLVAALTPIVRAEGSDERLVLLTLLVGSAVIGGFIFLGAIESQGGEFLPGLLLSFAIAALAAFGVAQTGRTSVGRALYVALVGDAFAPGALAVLLFAGLAIGSGCLE
jgi:hypothetical protein